MTAEMALAMPAVVLVLAVVLVTAMATATQLRCADGARAGARLAALGESDAAITQVARRVAGAGVRVGVHRDSPWVEVTVSTRSGGSWFTAGPWTVSATATAWQEP